MLDCVACLCVSRLWQGVSLARGKLGVAEKPTVSWAPAELAPSAKLLEECTAAFGHVSA